VVIGFGIPIFSVCHMPLVSRAAGDAAPAAVAMAACTFGVGGIVGNTLGGVVVDHWRPVGAYIVGAGWWLLAIAVLLLVPATKAEPRPAAGAVEDARQLSTGHTEGTDPTPSSHEVGRGEGSNDVQADASGDGGDAQGGGCCSLLRNRPYVGVLGITVLGNLFYWGHPPFIQVIADDLGSSATAAGALASSTGYGVLLGCVVCAARPPRRIGLVFASGMCVASALLAVAAVKNYAVVLLGLVAASSAAGLFGATQAALVMQAVPPAQHGIGMGVLSLAIGAQVRKTPGWPRSWATFSLF
jgi:MFS family permease